MIVQVRWDDFISNHTSSISVSVFNMKYMLSDEFSENSIIYRHFYCGLWAHLALYKYISCWLLTEGKAGPINRYHLLPSQLWSGTTELDINDAGLQSIFIQLNIEKQNTMCFAKFIQNR